MRGLCSAIGNKGWSPPLITECAALLGAFQDYRVPLLDTYGQASYMYVFRHSRLISSMNSSRALSPYGAEWQRASVKRVSRCQRVQRSQTPFGSISPWLARSSRIHVFQRNQTRGTEMNLAAERYFAMSKEQQKCVHIFLCEKALAVWESFIRAHDPLTYRETLCGTTVTVDAQLPRDALASVKAGRHSPRQ